MSTPPRLGPKMSDEELRNRFFYHPPPNPQRVSDHESVSRWCFDLARDLVALCPAGRNLDLTLEHLEAARMRANAALACDSPYPA